MYMRRMTIRVDIERHIPQVHASVLVSKDALSKVGNTPGGGLAAGC